MTPHIEWKKLAPHRPLDPGDVLHVRRPNLGGEQLAERLRAGLGPFAVAGPVGCGKSTELAACQAALDRDHVAAIVSLGTLTDSRSLAETDTIRSITLQLVADSTGPGKIDFSASFRNHLSSLGILPLQAPVRDLDLKGWKDKLRTVCREITRKGFKVAFLIDGLEKTEEQTALGITRSILEFVDEAEIVLVVPPSLAESHEILQVHGVHLFPIRPVSVYSYALFSDDGHKSARDFLKEVCLRRINWTAAPADFKERLDEAAFWSGGIPRVFLQIVKDAAGYAQLGNRNLPASEDFKDAIRDQEDSLGRLLQAGDQDILRAANNKSGMEEVPRDRKLRFVAHGLLLEYGVEGGQKVFAAPLIARRIGLAVGP